MMSRMGNKQAEAHSLSAASLIWFRAQVEPLVISCGSTLSQRRNIGDRHLDPKRAKGGIITVEKTMRNTSLSNIGAGSPMQDYVGLLEGRRLYVWWPSQ